MICTFPALLCCFHPAHFHLSFQSVQSLSRVHLFATPWTATRQASLSITNSQSLLRLMCIESGMPSNHLILWIPFSSCLQSFPESGSFLMSLLFTSGVQNIRASSFSISPSNEYSGLISFRIHWFDLLAVQGTSPVPQFNSIQPSLWSNSHIRT